MIAQAANVAGSVARRNAILSGVPKAYWLAGYEAARAAVAGDPATLGERSAEAFRVLFRLGVLGERVYAALDSAEHPVRTLGDIGAEQFIALRGLMRRLRDEGDAESVFPEVNGASPGAGARGVAGVRAAVEGTGAQGAGSDARTRAARTVSRKGPANAPDASRGEGGAPKSRRASERPLVDGSGAEQSRSGRRAR
jgi:hypothetical protein